jgi:hypothetical protein
MFSLINEGSGIFDLDQSSSDELEKILWIPSIFREISNDTKLKVFTIEICDLRGVGWTGPSDRWWIVKDDDFSS